MKIHALLSEKFLWHVLNINEVLNLTTGIREVDVRCNLILDFLTSLRICVLKIKISNRFGDSWIV